MPALSRFLLAAAALPAGAAPAALATGKICDASASGVDFDVGTTTCSFVAFDSRFKGLLDLGDEGAPKVELFAEDKDPIFHEGPVLFEDALYFTTNRLGDTSGGFTPNERAPQQLEQYINLMKMDLASKKVEKVVTEPPVLMGNGATKSADGKNIILLSQGFGDEGAKVYSVDPATKKATEVLSTFYGQPFNSFNDIDGTSDGLLFVTDPTYGFEQGFRNGQPQLGSNIYRYDTKTKHITLLSTRLRRPNGLALYDGRKKGEGCTLVFTDTGFEAGGQTHRGFNNGESALYFSKDPSGDCFANGLEAPPMARWPVLEGIQDGVLVHEHTKLLFVADGNGLWIWALDEVQPLGLVKMPEGATQVIFDTKAEGVATVYILSETKLWTVKVNFGAEGFVSAASQPPTAAPDAPEGEGVGYGAMFALGVLVGAAAVLLLALTTFWSSKTTAGAAPREVQLTDRPSASA